MTLSSLLADYQRGMLTPRHLAECLVSISHESNVDSVMKAAPTEVLPHVARFVHSFSEEGMICIGAPPPVSRESVDVVKRWLDRFDAERNECSLG
jgi:hypothetical protein